MTNAAPPLLLFVDGIDGSGKSTLARQLSHALAAIAINTWQLAVDDFRKPVDWQAAHDAQARQYYDDYFDLALLDDVLQRAIEGQTSLSLPVFTEGQARAWKTTWLAPCDVILLEGVFTQRLAAAAQAGLVYVNVDWAVARDRIVARDQAKGRSATDVNNRIDARYMPGQRTYEAQCQPKTRAHWLARLPLLGEGLKLQRTEKPLPPHPLWPQVQQALYKACATPAKNANDA